MENSIDAGATAITVEPIAFTNPLLRLRYWLEKPFRLAYRETG